MTFARFVLLGVGIGLWASTIARSAFAGSTNEWTRARLCRERFRAPVRAYLGGEDARRAWDTDPLTGCDPAPVDAGVRAAGDACPGPDSAPLLSGDMIDALHGAKLLIATVPDPIDSGYVYKYDGIVHAITFAIEEMGWQRDQSWLPWEEWRVANETLREPIEACRYRVPGLWLFRARDAHGPLVVLFVGETPTEGIDRSVFRRALELASPEVLPLVGIVGPTFSGSADSMRAVLDDWLGNHPARVLHHDRCRGEDPPRVRIFTGAATSPTVDGLLDDVSGVAFQRTILTDDVVEQQLLSWIVDREQLGPALGRSKTVQGVAILTESGTAYGNVSKASGDPWLPQVVLRFRRGVHDLQQAYARQLAKDRASVAQAKPLLELPRLALDPSLDDRSQPRAGEPEPSPKLVSAVDQELSTLLDQISKEGIRYVVIRATDVEDGIFLAQKLREVTPDVRVAFTSADALLTHPQYHDALIGSIVASSYPFLGTGEVSPAQDGIAPTRAPWEFSSAEGTYNATVALLGLHNRQRDGSCRLAEYAPFEPSNACIAGDPSFGDSVLDGHAETCAVFGPILPTWLGVIGNGAIFPLDALPNVPPIASPPCLFDPRSPSGRASGGSASGPNRDLALKVNEGARPPRAWSFLLALSVVGGLLMSLRWLRKRECLMQRGRRPRPTMFEAKLCTYAAARGMLVFALIGYMAAIHLVATRALGGPFELPYDPQHLALVFATVLGGFLVVWQAWQALCANFTRWLLALALVVLVCIFGSEPFAEWMGEGTCCHPFRCVVCVLVALAPALAVVMRPWAQARNAIRAFVKDRPPTEGWFWHRTHTFAVLGVSTIALIGFIRATWSDACRRSSLDSFSLEAHFRPPVARVVWVLRSVQLHSGSSAALVVVLVGAAIVLWLHGALQRLALTRELLVIDAKLPPDSGDVTTPLASVVGAVEGVADYERKLQYVLQRPAASMGSFLRSTAIFLVPYIAFNVKNWSTLEPRPHGRFLIVILGFATALVAMTIQHCWEYFHALLALLRRLRSWRYAECLRDAAGRVGLPVSVAITQDLNNTVDLGECATALQALPPTLPTWILADLEHEVLRLSETLQALHHRQAFGTTPESTRQVHAVRAADALSALVAEAAERVRTAVLDQETDFPPLDEATPKTTGSEGAAAKRAAPAVVAARRLLGCVVGTQLMRYVRLFRYYIASTALPAVLLVAAISVYPFQPQRLFLAGAWILVLALVATATTVYVALERNAVLSALSNTPPAKIPLNRDLVVRAFGWVVVPLVAIFAAQYPEFARLVFAVFTPLSRAFQ
jgi:hypothetical protein